MLFSHGFVNMLVLFRTTNFNSIGKFDDNYINKFEKIRISTLLSDEYDGNNAILRLNAGAGGTESQDWCEMLFRMYGKYCAKAGYKTTTIDYLEGDEAGIKSVSMIVRGNFAYGYLKYEKDGRGNKIANSNEYNWMIDNAYKYGFILRYDKRYEDITRMFDFIHQIYDDVEEKMELIDDKINDYTASTIDKMKHLVSMDESYKGKLTYLVKLIVDNKEHSDEICDIIVDNVVLQNQEYASKEGLYNKREIQISQELSIVEIVTEDKTGQDVDEMFDRIVQGYNTNKIKEFIVSRARFLILFTFYQLAFLTPGISPLCANSLKHTRQIPNFLI